MVKRRCELNTQITPHQSPSSSCGCQTNVQFSSSWAASFPAAKHSGHYPLLLNQCPSWMRNGFHRVLGRLAEKSIFCSSRKIKNKMVTSCLSLFNRACFSSSTFRFSNSSASIYRRM